MKPASEIYMFYSIISGSSGFYNQNDEREAYFELHKILDDTVELLHCTTSWLFHNSPVVNDVDQLVHLIAKRTFEYQNTIGTGLKNVSTYGRTVFHYSGQPTMYNSSYIWYLTTPLKKLALELRLKSNATGYLVARSDDYQYDIYKFVKDKA